MFGAAGFASSWANVEPVVRALIAVFTLAILTLQLVDAVRKLRNRNDKP